MKFKVGDYVEDLDGKRYTVTEVDTVTTITAIDLAREEVYYFDEFDLEKSE